MNIICEWCLAFWKMRRFLERGIYKGKKKKRDKLLTTYLSATATVVLSPNDNKVVRMPNKKEFCWEINFTSCKQKWKFEFKVCYLKSETHEKSSLYHELNFFLKCKSGKEIFIDESASLSWLYFHPLWWWNIIANKLVRHIGFRLSWGILGMGGKAEWHPSPSSCISHACQLIFYIY